MRLITEGKSLECKEIDADAVDVLSKERMEILGMLSTEAMYPAQIARAMNMQVQAVYYHIKLLEKAGLVGFVEYEEKRGAIAKKFASTADSFAVVLNPEAWAKYREEKVRIPKLLAPFVKNGNFNGRMVLGSPDPHGKYRARGNELCMVEFSMLLGHYAGFSFPLYVLDTELKE